MIEDHKIVEKAIFQCVYVMMPICSINFSAIIKIMVPSISVATLSGNLTNLYILIMNSIAKGSIKLCRIKYEIYESADFGFAIYSKFVKTEFIIKPEMNTMKSQIGIILVIGRILNLLKPINSMKKKNIKESVSIFSSHFHKFIETLLLV
ncbi:hypothetical protein GMD78_15485 [Ornithinibacillus sp. L9]|uniref:Uncharacterized protein n=1 Tax=Ornithinibacillus caprae TaxID=2678566 RepID=A0A6N8FJD4_9BACI|nr:hypothetical protein [Ornithinibacillus caprae]MUK89772.1 hypothetical protein [Ornithinibacillus caprae]